MGTKEKAKSRRGGQVDDPLFDRAEAAQYLGMSQRWIKGQLEAGSLPFTKLNRLVRFRKSDLDRYIEQHTTIPGDGS